MEPVERATIPDRAPGRWAGWDRGNLGDSFVSSCRRAARKQGLVIITKIKPSVVTVIIPSGFLEMSTHCR